MTQKLFGFFLLIILAVSNLNAQTVEDDDQYQVIDYGGMIMEVPKNSDFKVFPMGNGNYGFFSDDDPNLFFLAFSLDEDSSKELLTELLTDGGQSMLKEIGMKVSITAQSTKFNGIDALEYRLTGTGDKTGSSGRILTMEDQKRHFMLVYYTSEALAKDYGFIRMLASFDIDGNWIDEEDKEDEIIDLKREDFAETKDGYLIYDTEGVSFEFPSTWEIKEDSYSPRVKSYALSCEVSDSLTFFFMMSEAEIMDAEYIDNIPEEHSNVKYKTKKPVQKSFSGLKTKEYEFEIPSESDLPPMKGRMLFFNDEVHHFYIFYGEKGAKKESGDIKRLLQSFKIDSKK